MDVYEAIKERHSVRRYKDKKVDFGDLTKILDAGRFVQNAGGVNTIRFLVVDDKKKKEELVKASYSQHFLAQAPIVIIICSDMKRITQLYSSDSLIYARQQAGASAQNMALEAVNLNLASCIVQGFEESKIKKIFKIPDDIKVDLLFTLGYSDSVKAERHKYELEKILHKNKW